MAFKGLKSFVDLLDAKDELIRITEFVDPVLEITEVTDRISKLAGGGKALLFENNGTRFPLMINALGSDRRLALAFGREDLEHIEHEISELFGQLTSARPTLWQKLKMLPRLKELASWMPAKIKGRGTCQEIVMAEPDLLQLPVLKCWPADGGRFITLPAVHTTDPVTGSCNTGMYRMQALNKNTTGMHWHRHKTGAAHFAGYKALGRKMPVTVTLGGDPSYIYSATAPMPENVSEYLLAGFLRKKKVRQVKCLTNDLYIPEDVDFVIEGYVDPAEDMIWEGPFGDHTGFYSLADFYPCFHVTCITHRRDAVYPATVVGIPPMEDAWIGKATERIFLSPIRMTMIPELIDMHLPFPGVAHNISIVKIRKTYPGQAVKVINSLWGAGQMMFNKILIVVDDQAGEAPVDEETRRYGAKNTEQGALSKGHGAECESHGVTDRDKSHVSDQNTGTMPRRLSVPHLVDIHDYSGWVRLFSDYFDPDYSMHFSRGPLDILDHSSQNFAYGSKLGIDLTTPFPEERKEKRSTVTWPVSENVNWNDLPGVTASKNLIPEMSLPVLLLTVVKNGKSTKTGLEDQLMATPGAAEFKVILLFDDGVDLNDLFSLVWLLGGNLEPERDITVLEMADGNKTAVADATIKTLKHDNFSREWPNVVTMDDRTIVQIDQKWPQLGLGELLPSPSLKYKKLALGDGSVRGQ